MIFAAAANQWHPKSVMLLAPKHPDSGVENQKSGSKKEHSEVLITLLRDSKPV